MGSDLQQVFSDIAKGKRIDKAAALSLLLNASPVELGFLAQERRFFHHPEPAVTYIIDRNINYTNICETLCAFCAFSRAESEEGAYSLSIEDLLQKVKETVELGGTGILLQGGHNPKLPFSYYLDMLSAIKRDFPDIHIHAFSPPEIVFFSNSFGMSVPEVLSKLREAGLQSLPGGGAEILTEKSRKRIAPKKATTEEWLGVMEEAHRLGIPSTATMMFGAGEGDDEIVEHLDRVRSLQDRTGGFTAFIPWTYQPGGRAKLKVEKASYTKYLKVLALSRIYLDNIKNIQASWLTQGLDIGQVALHFGANDLGSVMIEENVVRAAGCSHRTNEAELREVIATAGFAPKKRRTLYEGA
ncbi:MAG TPA: cyclic dehypoxanthinyl futalosine synthase [Acidobacteriota bacterium]|nr:cyclic dehypoxanthinyl futalosine synthase [Acidobacteriota bacterium]HNT18163.1 cyclic dehypoxanthinyl futalosine synthase [Acidobacteriota bacterium]